MRILLSLLVISLVVITFIWWDEGDASLGTKSAEVIDTDVQSSSPTFADRLPDIDRTDDAEIFEEEAQLQIHVRDWQGQPVEGALVALQPIGGVARWTLSDSEGNATLLPSDEAGWLVVVSKDHPPHFAQLEQGLADSMTIQLRRGIAITGRITRLGGRPAEPLSVSLSPDVSLRPRKVLDDVLVREMFRVAPQFERGRVETLADGSFAFPPTLPEEWTGTLAIEGHFPIAGATEGVVSDDRLSLKLAYPAPSVLIDLGQRHVLLGRVIDPAGRPIEGMMVQADVILEDDELLGFGRSDEEGRFLLIVDPRDALRVELTLRVNGKTHLEREISGDDIARRTAQAGECDLGDFVVEGVRSLVIRVRTDDGVHPKGAFARWKLNGGSNRHGIGGDLREIDLSPFPVEVTAIEVGKEGYETETLEIGSEAGEFEVTLRRDALLDVMVHTASGDPAERLAIWWEQEGERAVHLNAKGKGLYRTYDFDPGRPGTLTLRSGWQLPVFGQKRIEATFEARSRVEWRLDRDPTELTVFFPGPTEEVARYQVRLDSTVGARVQSGRIVMDPSPRATFGDLWHDEVVLIASYGHSHRRETIPLRPGPQEHTLGFDFGRHLEVDLRSSGDLAFPPHVEIVSDEPGRETWRQLPSRRIGALYEFAELEATQYRLRVLVGAWSHERLVAPTDTSLTVDLPRPVTVEVTWSDPRVAHEKATAWLIPEKDADRPAPFGVRRRAQGIFESYGIAKVEGLPPGDYRLRLYLGEASERAKPEQVQSVTIQSGTVQRIDVQ
ncbi:MAG: hypothetical protein RL885_25555 [Planctomycetota bacterium]